MLDKYTQIRYDKLIVHHKMTLLTASKIMITATAHRAVNSYILPPLCIYNISSVQVSIWLSSKKLNCFGHFTKER